MKIVSLAWDAEEKSSIQIAFIEDFSFFLDAMNISSSILSFLKFQHLKKNYFIL